MEIACVASAHLMMVNRLTNVLPYTKKLGIHISHLQILKNSRFPKRSRTYGATAKTYIIGILKLLVIIMDQTMGSKRKNLIDLYIKPELGTQKD